MDRSVPLINYQSDNEYYLHDAYGNTEEYTDLERGGQRFFDDLQSPASFFTRQDDVEASWQLLTPILQAWEQDPSAPPVYPAGSESFPQADRLPEADGRKWRRLAPR